MPISQVDLPEIEYLDGRPHPKMSPKTAHSFVQGALYRLILTCAGTRGSAGPEWRFRPGAGDGTVTVFVPDVAFVSHERLKALRGRDFDEPPFSPDIAVEVRSPGDNLKYLHKKIARYLATGSVLVLDVDPGTRTIHAHAKGSQVSYGPGMTFVHESVPWLQFAVNEVFADLDRSLE